MNRKREFTVDSIEKWKKTLPLSDLSASTKAVYVFFDDLRATPISTQRRFEALCALRQTIGYLSQNLKKFYSKQEVLTEQQGLISDLTTGLYQEMLDGYKIIIAESSQSFFKRKLLLQAIQNAMHYCVLILFHTYQQHRLPQPGLWLQLHSLYILAQQKYLLNVPLPKILEWNYQLKTLDIIYKHCLLFVLSSPYRLRREQIDYLVYALEAWTPLLSFSKTDIEHALFIVDYESDAPPQYTSLSFHPIGQYNYLHLEKINRRLLKLLSYRKSGQQAKSQNVFSEAEGKLPLSFIDYLLSSWQRVPERRSQRHKAHDFVTVTLSISSIHWFIDHPDLNPIQDESGSERHIYYSAEVVDQSEGGYCLRWVEKIPTNLQSGEVLGIISESKSGKKSWGIGAIRWLKQDQDSTVYIGIQMLSSEAVAVTTKLVESETSQPIPTLLLGSEENKGVRLITPSLPFKSGQEVEIHYHDKDYATNLQQVRTQSPSYQEFELEFRQEPLIFQIDDIER